VSVAVGNLDTPPDYPHVVPASEPGPITSGGRGKAKGVQQHLSTQAPRSMGRKSRVPRSAMMGVIGAGVAGFMGGLSRPSGSRTPPRLIEGPDTRTVASAGRTFDDPGAGPASCTRQEQHDTLSFDGQY